MTLEIVTLSRAHDRNRFDCGKEALNTFLRHTAREQAGSQLSRTRVLCDSTMPDTILGYCTLAFCEIETDPALRSRYRTYPHPLPALRLARLAIDLRWQQQGYGGLLVVDAMKRCLRAAEHGGLVGLVVDAKDDSAAPFYRKLGFSPLQRNPLTLFMPLGTCEKALGKN